MHIRKNELTQKHLKECLNYCPETGHLTWIKKLCSKVVIGNRAGCQVKGRDNRILKIFGEVYREHRIIWFMMTGHMPEIKEHIDHINHNESDNSWANLRLVTQAENNKNLSKRTNTKTGVTGISISKVNGNKKFMAEITCNGIRKRKAFYTLEEARECRKLWENELGFHPNHGIAKPI